MAVISYREVLPRTVSHRFGESPTAERKYIATVDEPTGSQTVINTIGIFHGASHPEFSFLRMIDLSLNEIDREHVEITYSYEVPEQSNLDPNPLARPDIWAFSVGGATVPALSYYYGEGNGDIRPLVNAAGDFIEGLTRVESEVRATISGNRSSFPLGQAAAVTNAINSAPYLGGAAYTWQCAGLTAQQAVEIVNDFEIRYWQVTAELVYRQSGWIEKIPHVGFHYLEGNQKRRAWVYASEPGSSDKVDATAPQPLTESGELKYPGLGGDPDQLLRRMFPVVEFSGYFGVPPF